MREAVGLAEMALDRAEELGHPLLKQSMDLGLDCFERWDLCHGDLGEHLDWLKRHGAEAVKPTGSGGGGYALSLWQSPPPEELGRALMTVPQPIL
jgi:mevalonate kinase